MSSLLLDCSTLASSGWGAVGGSLDVQISGWLLRNSMSVQSFEKALAFCGSHMLSELSGSSCTRIELVEN